MKKQPVLWMVVLIVLLFLSSCGGQEPAQVEKTTQPTATDPAAVSTPANEESQPFVVTDALGREITFDKIPTRIALVGKALFMVADAIYLFPEAGDRIVAIGSTNQGGANFLPIVDDQFENKIMLESEVGPEQIAAVQPDCVILKSSNAEKLGTPLEILGIPVVYLDFETPEQYQRDLNTLGQLFNNPERAQYLINYYENQFDEINSVTSTLSEAQKPRTLLLYYSEKDGSVAFNVPPIRWMQTIQVEAAGGNPVWKDANPTDGWTKVTLEQIAAWNPEVILVVAYTGPATDIVEELKLDPQWQQLEAVKNGRLYAYARDIYSWDQPDTRWILGTSWLATVLHPELFPDMDIISRTKNFYQDLYAIDQNRFEEKIEPMLQGVMN